MYFNTLTFFGFFLTVYLVHHWLSPRQDRMAGIALFVASIVFYVVAGVFDTVLIVGLIAFNWLIIRLISNERWRVALAVAGNIGLLALIKYRAFLLGAGAIEGTTYINTVLPLGISFYTFQLLAFQIDASRTQALKTNPGLSFPLFITFFPQLIAGPIVRAQQMLPQITRLISGRPRRLRLVSFGLGLCLLGLTKKIIFADSLAPIVDDIFFLEHPSTFEAWLGAWLFTFQIYFDFSGYTDIALGCAYLLGIRLPWNFRTPYMSDNPREFWQRWHITLSTWIRDYLYIPLGGQRGGKIRQLSVLLFVMGLAGLWHGADITFVVWGLAWGAYIAVSRLLPRKSVHTGLATTSVRWGGHLFIVVLLWVLFRAPNLSVALNYFSAMFTFSDLSMPNHWQWTIVGCVLLMLLHFMESRFLQRKQIAYSLKRINNPFTYGLMFGLCLWLVMLPSYDVNPFIYFRF